MSESCHIILLSCLRYYYSSVAHPAPSTISAAAWRTFYLVLQVLVDKERGRDLASRQYNIRFYGNPGTGKTSVARLYAGLLKELGVLPGNSVVETAGAAMVSGGLTELKK